LIPVRHSAPAGLGDHRFGGVAVLQAERVDDEMALMALDLLACVEAGVAAQGGTAHR
jgi:hypothetical protein